MMPNIADDKRPQIDQHAAAQSSLNAVRDAATNLVQQDTRLNASGDVRQAMQALNNIDASKVWNEDTKRLDELGSALEQHEQDPSQLWSAREGLEREQRDLEREVSHPPSADSPDQKVAEYLRDQERLATIQPANELARELETALNENGSALKQAATDLSSQIKDDAKFQGGVTSRLPESQREMGDARLNQRLGDLDKAIQSFDPSKTEGLDADQTKLVDNLRFALRDAWTSDPSELWSARQELDRAAATDPRLAEAANIGRAAHELLNEMGHTSVSCVERQPVQEPNTEPREAGRNVMGASATEVANREQRCEWMHMLARMFGAGDPDKNFVAGGKEPHKDMSRIENLSRAINENKRIEVEITASHKAIDYDAKVKDRVGYELRYQVWVSDRAATDRDSKPDPNARKIIDARLDLQSAARDAALKPMFEELKNLRDALRDGGSPEQAVERLEQLLKEAENDPLEDEQRLARIYAENTGGELDPKG